MSQAGLDFSTLNVDQLVGLYVNLRDRIKKADEDHKTKMSPSKEMLQQINDQLLARLNAAGGESIKTSSGTTYRTTKATASISDSQAFRDYVIANELWDVLDWRANSTAVAEHIQEFGAEPPGIKYSTVFTVGVRRAGEK